MSDSLRRLEELAAADPEFASLHPARQKRIREAIQRAAKAQPDEGAFGDEGLLQSRRTALEREIPRLAGPDRKVALKLIEAEAPRARADLEHYWKEKGPEAARDLAGGAADGIGSYLAWWKDPVDPATKARLERGYGIGLSAAIRERVLEEQPGLAGDQLEAEIKRRAEDGETIRGGQAGFWGERFAPAAIGLGREALPILGTQLVASALPGIGNAAAAASTATRLGNVARLLGRGAAIGATLGATRPLAPDVQRELDAAGAGYLEAAAARGKAALKGAAYGAAMGGLGEALGIGLDKVAGAFGKAALGRSLPAGMRWERNPELARWMGEHGARVTALRMTREAGINVASDLAIAGVTDPEELMRNPKRVLADSLANAIIPAAIYGRASRETNPRQLAELRAAIKDDVFNFVIDDALKSVEGLPLRHRMELLKLYDAELTGRGRDVFGDSATIFGSTEGLRAGWLATDRMMHDADSERSSSALILHPSRLAGARPQEMDGFVGFEVAAGLRGAARLSGSGGAVREREEMRGAADDAAMRAAAELHTTDPAAPRNVVGFEPGMAEPAREAAPERFAGEIDYSAEQDIVSRMVQWQPTEALRPRAYDLQRMLMLREEVAKRAAGAVSKAKKPVKGDPADWASIAGRRHDQLDALDAEIAAMRRDPERAAGPEQVVEQAAAMRSFGAAMVEAKDQAELAASRLEDEASVPVDVVPEAATKTPRGAWSADETEALQRALSGLNEARTTLELLGEHAAKKSRVAQEAKYKTAEAEVRDLLMAKDGRSMEELERVPYDSQEWVENPALAAMRRAGWTFEDKEHGGRTADLTRGRLRQEDGDKVAGFVAQVGGIDKFDRWLRRTVLKDRMIAERLGGRPSNDLLEELVDLARTAAMHHAVVDEGAPAGALDRVTAAVRREVTRRASALIAQEKAEREAEVRVSIAMQAELESSLREASRESVEQRAPGPVADAGSPQARPVADVEAVIDIASRPGGPLHGEPDAVIVAELLLGRVAAEGLHSSGSRAAVAAEAQRMQQESAQAGRGPQVSQQAPPSKVRYGKTFVDIARAKYEASTGKPWSTAGTAKGRLTSEARRRYGPKVDLLEQYLRDTAKLQDLGTSLVRDADGNLVAKLDGGLAQMYSGLGAGRKLIDWLFDTTTERGPKDYTMEERAAMPPLRGVRALFEKTFGTGAADAGRATLSSITDIVERSHAWLKRARREASKLMPTWNKMSDDAVEKVYDRLDGYRRQNNGLPLNPALSESRWRQQLASMSAEEREGAQSMLQFFRWNSDSVKDQILRSNPDQPMIRESYAMHISAEDFVGRQTLLEQFGETLSRVKEIKQRTADLARAKTPTGAPGSERLLRRDESGTEYVTDLRLLVPQLLNSIDFAGRYSAWHAFKDDGLGKLAPIAMPKGQRLDEYMQSWRLTPQLDSENALRVTLGQESKPLYMGVIGDIKWANTDGGIVEFKAKTIGGSEVIKLRASDDGRGNLAFKRWVGNDEKGAWHPVTNVEARQGGRANLLQATRGKDGRLMVDRSAVDRYWSRAEMVVGKNQLGTTEKAVSALMSWTSSRYLGDLNHQVAAKNFITQTITSAHELGPRWLVEGVKLLRSQEGRALLRSVGIWSSELSDPEHGALRDVVHGAFDTSSEYKALPKDASRGQRLLARYHDLDAKGRGLFQIGEDTWKGVTYLGARARAMEQLKTSGMTTDETRLMASRGVDAKDHLSTAAHWRAIASTARSGAMIDIVTQPMAMKNPLFRLLMQFQRPAMAMMNYGFGLARNAFEEIGDAAKGSIRQRSLRPFANRQLGDAMRPIARWVTASLVLSFADEAMGTNLFGSIGPRLVDLGQETFGVSLGDAYPELDEPDESPITSRLQVPFASIGVGPSLGILQNLSRAGLAWLKGDEEGLESAFWADTNAKQRLMEGVVPAYSTLRRLSYLANPADPVVGPEIAGSEVASKPYMVLDAKGRPITMTTEDALQSRGLFGSITDRTSVDELRTRNRTRRQLRERNEGFRSIRRQWYDARRRLALDGSPEDLLEVEQLEAKARGIQRELDMDDFEHEERLRELPAWMREIAGGRSNDEKAQAILSRWKALGPDGSGSMQPDELRWAFDRLIKDVGSLSPAMLELSAQAFRRAER